MNDPKEKALNLSSIMDSFGTILNVPMATHGDTQKAIATENGIAIAGNNNVVININVTTNEIALLQERITLLQRLLDEKERLIQVLLKINNK